MIYVWLVSKFRNAFSYIAHFDFFGKCFETNRILNVRVVSFYRKLFGLIPNALNLNRFIGRLLQTFIIFISLPIKWGASFRWPSSLYCNMRNTSEQMTIGKTHPSLHVLGHLEVFNLSSSLHFSVSTICLQMYFSKYFLIPREWSSVYLGQFPATETAIPWDTIS